jgi:hypothetical protein
MQMEFYSIIKAGHVSKTTNVKASLNASNMSLYEVASLSRAPSLSTAVLNAVLLNIDKWCVIAIQDRASFISLVFRIVK